jgi:membrane peptidoglycan carboxypeptidase
VDGGAWALRSIPKVSGAFVVENPSTGRILAMQGGFDSRLGSFNRANPVGLALSAVLLLTVVCISVHGARSHTLNYDEQTRLTIQQRDTTREFAQSHIGVNGDSAYLRSRVKIGRASCRERVY